MDIFNNNERRVVCVANDVQSTFPGFEHNTMLTVGEKYTVIDVEVHSWHTLVTLREFPNKRFNSVLFEEIEAMETPNPLVTIHPHDCRNVEDVLGRLVRAESFEPHGSIVIHTDATINQRINHLDDSLELIFNGFDGINMLISRLERLRDRMHEIHQK